MEKNKKKKKHNKMRNLFENFSWSDEEVAVPDEEVAVADSQICLMVADSQSQIADLDQILSKFKCKPDAKVKPGKSSKIVTSLSNDSSEQSLRSHGNDSSDVSRRSQCTHSSSASQQLDSLLRSARTRARKTKRGKKKPVVVFNEDLFSSSDSSPDPQVRQKTVKNTSLTSERITASAASALHTFVFASDSDESESESVGSHSKQNDSVAIIEDSFEESGRQVSESLDHSSGVLRNVTLQTSLATDTSVENSPVGEQNVSLRTSQCNAGDVNGADVSLQTSQCSAGDVNGADVSLQVSFSSSDSAQTSPQNSPLPSDKTVSSEHSLEDKCQQASFSEDKCQQASFSEDKCQQASFSDSSTPEKPTLLLDERRVPQKQVRHSLSGSDVEFTQCVRPKLRQRKAAAEAQVARKESCDSDSSEPDLDDFLARMKQPTRRVTSSSSSEHSLDSFIVPDGEVSFEDQALYVNTDRKLRERHAAPTYRYRETSSTSSGSTDSSTDDSDVETGSDAEDSDWSASDREPSDNSDLEITFDIKTKTDSGSKQNIDIGAPTEALQRISLGSSDSECESLKENQAPSDVKRKISREPDSGNVEREASSSHKEIALKKSLDDVCRAPERTTLSDEDFQDSVFKTPVPVKGTRRPTATKPLPLVPSLSCNTPLQRPPLAHHGLTAPPRRPLALRSEDSPKPASAQQANSAHSFLASLNDDVNERLRHPLANRYVKSFKKHRDELTAKLFEMFNRKVFDEKLPRDMTVKWNPRLTTTAGFCAYKRQPAGGDRGATCRIELSTKVCDRAERLRDTLIHEMCHAAVWVLHSVREGHGRFWQLYARKAMRVFPELPIVARCHNYDIHCKFTYRCTGCGYQIGRHSKSLDTERKVCGHCRSPFELLTSSRAGSSASGEPATPRTPNRFALFVKEHYASVKKSGSLSHAEVMKQLSQDFAAMKRSGSGSHAGVVQQLSETFATMRT